LNGEYFAEDSKVMEDKERSRSPARTEWYFSAQAERKTSYNIVVVGPSFVGKEALVRRLVRENSVKDHVRDYRSKTYSHQLTVDGEDCILSIDLVCDEEPLTRVDYLYQKADGFLLVYSTVRDSTLQGATSMHKGIIEKREKTPLVLVGNRVDLEQYSQVSSSEGEELARKFSCPFFEASALSGANVEEAFHCLVREIRRLRQAECCTNPAPARRLDPCLLL